MVDETQAHRNGADHGETGTVLLDSHRHDVIAVHEPAEGIPFRRG
jgi:hypothetical protein